MSSQTNEHTIASSRGLTVALLAIVLLVAAGLAFLGSNLVTNPDGGSARQEAVSMDQRMLRIADRLQCPVCDGQSVAFSESQLATEMRRMIAEKLEAGESERQILDYFVDRYGVKILREPPRSGLLAWLWITPVAAFVIAALWLGWTTWRMTRRPSVQNGASEGSNESETLDEEVRALLAQNDEELFAR